MEKTRELKNTYQKKSVNPNYNCNSYSNFQLRNSNKRTLEKFTEFAKYKITSEFF